MRQNQNNVMVSKRKYIRGIIISVLVTVLLIVAGGAVFFKYADVYGVIAQLSGSKSPVVKLESILKSVMNGYIKELDEETLIDAAIKGMLKAVDDPYTYYLNSDEYDSFFSSKNPTFTGIGVSVDLEAYTDSVLVKEVYKESGAFVAGIKADDRIVAVYAARLTIRTKCLLRQRARKELGLK